ncbi:12576_t:CDS:2 [Funneliformis caledonium]|uniref:12576_t:CDS:1 n=1 Tax=Funneliformis caledonium TaxID=1117310 RepID=A0A9N9C7L4_9GLOM|nr:12576_t:CDS:2 [Funneliformis caledonium]
MVKRQHKTSSSSTSAQIRKPAVTTRSKSNQKIELVNSIEQQKKIAFDMKRKRKSAAEVITPEENDEIDRRSPPSNSNNTKNSEDKESVLSPPKRAKLLTRVGHNDGQSNVDNNELKRESEMIEDSAQQNNDHDKPLRRSVDKSSTNNKKENDDKTTKDIEKDENKNNEKGVIQSNDEIIQDINTITESFKDVVEIRGTQMVIGNFVVEYDQYQEFMTLLNQLVDILETYDSEKVLQSAKKIGSKGNNSGQVLNLTLFRAKITKRSYKSLNEFQDDFICTCNDVINAADPKMHNAASQLLKFGSRLFEQAYKKLPRSIRQLDVHDKNSVAIALVQPTSDGHVFSSGAVKQLPQQNGKKDAIKLVGDLQDMAVVSLQSMDKQEIPTFGSILPKKRENSKFLQPEERNVPGIKFHRYKAYASFAPIYDSSDATLSYEDTMLARTYKKHKRVSKRINKLDLSEEGQVKKKSSSNVETTSVGVSAEQNNSGNGNNVENSDKDKFFEDIDVDLLYKSIKRTQPNEIDEMLDEHAEIFRKVRSMQEKRLIKSSQISAKERKYVYKLQKQLANLISKVSPSDIVSFSAVENAMDNLLIKERSFKGVLPPNKSFAHPTNEVSRDVFGNLSRKEISSVDRNNTYARNMNSKDTLPQGSLAGPSSVTNSASRQQSMPSQSLHHPTPHQLPLPMSASMPYTQSSRATASQVPMRMQYGASQGTSTQMHANYQMTYSRPLPTQSQVPTYYPSQPSQRYPYGYPYYPQYGYSMGHSSWQQRPSYY